MQHPRDTPKPLAAPFRCLGCSPWQLPSPESARQAFLGATELNIADPLMKHLQVGSKRGIGMNVPGKEERALEKKLLNDCYFPEGQGSSKPLKHTTTWSSCQDIKSLKQLKVSAFKAQLYL